MLYCIVGYFPGRIPVMSGRPLKMKLPWPAVVFWTNVVDDVATIPNDVKSTSQGMVALLISA